LKNPKVWHFNFRGPDVERLVAGRLLDRFYNELSANPSRIEDVRPAALYARPNALHNALRGQFAAFAQDAIDNQQLVAKGKLEMPVLAIRSDPLLWPTSGHRNRFRGRECTRRGDRAFRSLDHGGATGAGGDRHPLVPKGRMSQGISRALGISPLLRRSAREPVGMTGGFGRELPQWGHSRGMDCFTAK